jgi:hypothetical protein
MAAGAALAAKRGEAPKSKLKGASRQMADSMTEKELHDMAATPRKSLPRKKGSSSSKSASSKRSTGTASKRSTSRSQRSK